MSECIICRTEKDNLTDEHVIPDALGGYYHIHTVCKDCNDKLGGNIDTPLVRHWFSEFERDALSIKGKTGCIPDPLAGTYILQDHPNKKARLQRDKDGQYAPFLYSSIEENENGLGISIDKSNSRKEVERLKNRAAKQLAEKLRVPIEQIAFKEEEIRCYESPWMHAQKEIDLHFFKLGLLKIGYEFAVDSLSEYYSDPTAIEISKFLYDVANCTETDLCDELCDKIGQFVRVVGMGIDSPNALAELFDFTKNKHYLMLSDSPEGLICFIRLHNTFSAMVMLSKKHLPEEKLLVGINDIDGKNFVKLNILEIANLLTSTGKPL